MVQKRTLKKEQKFYRYDWYERYVFYDASAPLASGTAGPNFTRNILAIVWRQIRNILAIVLIFSTHSHRRHGYPAMKSGAKLRNIEYNWRLSRAWQMSGGWIILLKLTGSCPGPPDASTWQILVSNLLASVRRKFAAVRRAVGAYPECPGCPEWNLLVVYESWDFCIKIDMHVSLSIGYSSKLMIWKNWQRVPPMPN